MREKVITIIADYIGLPKKEVEESKNLYDDLKMDSLDVLEIIMELEDEFNITIPDETYFEIKSVDDIIGKLKEFIDDKQNKSHS